MTWYCSLLISITATVQTPAETIRFIDQAAGET
jgi:hypothetical protein